MTWEEAEIFLIQTAARLAHRYDDAYATLLAENPDHAKNFYSNMIEGSVPSLRTEPVSMKYIRRAASYIYRWRTFASQFAGIRKAYEIGVGPGHLFYLLDRAMGIEMSGCDLPRAAHLIFRDMQSEIGIDKQVHEHIVRARQDIPIVEGAEALLAFYTVFNSDWDASDHRWFLDHCRERLSGPKKLVLLFNETGFGDRADVQALYRNIGEFPWLGRPDLRISDRDRGAFCVVHLDQPKLELSSVAT